MRPSCEIGTRLEEGLCTRLTTVDYLAPYLPDIKNHHHIMCPDIFRPYGAHQFSTSVAYDEARMDMRDDGWEVIVGMGVEGEIHRWSVFIGRKGVLTMNRYKEHIWVCKERVPVNRPLFCHTKLSIV